MALMEEIREYRVEKKSVAAWWLGQNSFIFKTPEGLVAGVDLYLTDSCNGLQPGLDLSRRVPVLIQPEELDVDLFLCTHNHQDHTDPETIRHLRHKDAMRFIGPPPSCGVFRQHAIEEGRITLAWPDCLIEHGDLTIRGTFALPTDDTDLNHMGFVFEVGGGPRIYMTGDTDYHELLTSAARYRPNVMITCINGGFNNLSHFEAAVLAGQVKPQTAIPCHYDMFPDNCVDPKQFEAALKLKAPDVAYRELAHGKLFTCRVD